MELNFITSFINNYITYYKLFIIIQIYCFLFDNQNFVFSTITITNNNNNNKKQIDNDYDNNNVTIHKIMPPSNYYHKHYYWQPIMMRMMNTETNDNSSISNNNNNNNKQNDPSPLESVFLPTYIDFQKDVIDLLNFQYNHSIINSNNNNNHMNECQTDIRLALHSLRLGQNWAIQMFNSWGKFPPTGLVSGTFTDLGDYDQCIRIHANISRVDPISEDKELFSNRIYRTQYCRISIAPPLPPFPRQLNYYHEVKNLLPPVPLSLSLSFYQHMAHNAAIIHYSDLQIGFCVPERCSLENITTVAKKSKTIDN